MASYSIWFFTNRKEPDALTARVAADKAKRGGLTPIADHFCGVDACKRDNGGCRIQRQFKVACVYTGDYTWPKN